MSFSLIEWFKQWFQPNICGLCTSTKSKKYHILYYRVSDFGDVQDMKICDECMTVLEDASETSKKYIEDEKKKNESKRKHESLRVD